jgi:hypothetical protein
MPTGTSTIFGAFQAIVALLANAGRIPPLATKLPREKNFASEFLLDRGVAAMQNNGPVLRLIEAANGFPKVRRGEGIDARGRCVKNSRIKNL